jgi:hypothetical protein
LNRLAVGEAPEAEDVEHPLVMIGPCRYEVKTFWDWRPGRRQPWFPRVRDDRVSELVIKVPSWGDCLVVGRYALAEHRTDMSSFGQTIALQLGGLREWFPNLKEVLVQTEVWHVINSLWSVAPSEVSDTVRKECAKLPTVDFKTEVVIRPELDKVIVGYGTEALEDVPRDQLWRAMCAAVGIPS